MLSFGMILFFCSFIFIVIWNFALINPSIFNKNIKHRDEALKFLAISTITFLVALFFFLYGIIDNKPIHFRIDGMREKFIALILGLAVFYFGFYIFRNGQKYTEQLKKAGYKIPEDSNKFERSLKFAGFSIMLFIFVLVSSFIFF